MFISPLESRGASNNTKLVHWSLLVGCYIWYSEEGIGRGPSPPSPLLAVPNVTAHPSTASVYQSLYCCIINSTLLCSFNVGIKGSIVFSQSTSWDFNIFFQSWEVRLLFMLPFTMHTVVCFQLRRLNCSSLLQSSAISPRSATDGVGQSSPRSLDDCTTLVQDRRPPSTDAGEPAAGVAAADLRWRARRWMCRIVSMYTLRGRAGRPPSGTTNSVRQSGHVIDWPAAMTTTI